MPAVSERVFRVQAPYDGNAVHLYFVRGVKLALIDSGAADSPLAAVEPALRELGLWRTGNARSRPRRRCWWLCWSSVMPKPARVLVALKRDGWVEIRRTGPIG